MAITENKNCNYRDKKNVTDSSICTNVIKYGFAKV